MLQFFFGTILFCAILLPGYSNIVFKTLYINKGTFTTVNKTAFPFLAFNPTPVFDSLNSVIKITTSDTLVLKVINNDTATHGFDVKGITGTGATISADDSATKTISFSQQGVYIYYDNYQYPKYRYLGLGGMICVSNSITAKKFYWNIKEHQTSFNSTLINGGTVNWSNYDPDYFTINSKSHPDLQNDSTAKVRAYTGDTVIIFIANTGHSKHSLHFHGFHSAVMYSSDSFIQNNSKKDTWPLKRMESLMLIFIPDKTGKYSVHDHNLVAVSGGGTHPNGMFTIMEIQ